MEKRLIYDCSIVIQKPITYVITDLTTYYNRQLPNIESLVIELAGLNQNIVVLIAKVLPIL